jgi:serine/threonine protein kinase
MEQKLPEIEGLEIVELLGQGGMSLVYKARQKELDRLVAVKVLSATAISGEEGIKRFHKEARLTSNLDHPHIVKTYSFGVSAEGQPYLVMEYLEGRSLAAQLKMHGRLPLQKFKEVFLPVLSALAQAHEAGLVHRDIKPENIMICAAASESETVKLVDFGIAKILAEQGIPGQALTRTGALLGTPAYMSPEQCQGKPLDGRSDLYSLACVMYESLRGEPPCHGDSPLEIMQKHSFEPPPRVADLTGKVNIPPGLAEAVLSGLAQDPQARPKTAAEFALKLGRELEGVRLDEVPALKKSAASFAGLLAPQLITIALVAAAVLACLFVVHQMLSAQKTVTPSELAVRDKIRKNEKIESMLKRALVVAEKRSGSDDGKILEPLCELCEFYIQLERYDDAFPLCKRILAVRQARNPDGADTAESLVSMARCFENLKGSPDFARAESLLKQALKIQHVSLAAVSPYTANTQFRLAECCENLGKLDEAENWCREETATWDLVLQSEDPITNMVDHKLGADQVNRERLHAFRGRNSSLFHTAIYCERQGRLAEAEKLYKSSQAMGKYGLDREWQSSVDRLAGCLRRQGKTAESEALQRQNAADQKPGR